MAHFVDCIDYGMGLNEMAMTASCPDGADFFDSGKKDLNSAIADLMQDEPNSNSMQHSYAAIEKFTKAYLSYKFNFAAQMLKNKPFGHKLEQLVAQVQKCDSAAPIGTIDVSVISPYAERYEGTVYTRLQLWEAYRRAQFAGACLTRTLTSRDSRSSMSIPLTFF